MDAEAFGELSKKVAARRRPGGAWGGRAGARGWRHWSWRHAGRQVAEAAFGYCSRAGHQVQQGQEVLCRQVQEQWHLWLQRQGRSLPQPGRHRLLLPDLPQRQVRVGTLARP